MSVINFVLKRTARSSQPIKSKVLYPCLAISISLPPSHSYPLPPTLSLSSSITYTMFLCHTRTTPIVSFHFTPFFLCSGTSCLPLRSTKVCCLAHFLPTHHGWQTQGSRLILGSTLCGMIFGEVGSFILKMFLSPFAKYERFFHNSSVAVATVFAPVGLPPTPVLVFQEQEEGNLFFLSLYRYYTFCEWHPKFFCSGVHILVATGSLHSVNPDRIICKKIVLSGQPFKIHRRSAVIRYMFFNRGRHIWIFWNPSWV